MNTVTSADGTTIAYETTGSGPALVIVGNVADDRHGFDGLAAALAKHFTVYNYDRRGRGESGDTPPYAPAREIEDLDALLAVVGEPALLVSGSGGTVLCLEAATALGGKVAGLFLYEPPFIVDDSRPPAPADYVETVERLVAEGRRDEALEHFFVDVVGVPAEYMDPMKADPSWQTMVRYAHTLAYDGRIVAGTQDGKPLPTDRWDISAPVRVVAGGDSPDFFHTGARALADLLENATYEVLPGHDHGAPWATPEPVAALIAERG